MLDEIWLPIGFPGYFGARKKQIFSSLDRLIGKEFWRLSHVVNGKIIEKESAIYEYENSYRNYLVEHPALLEHLVHEYGNFYDFDLNNVYNDNYWDTENTRNHFHDIAIRKVIREIYGLRHAESKSCSLFDITSGRYQRSLRSPGLLGNKLLQIRGPKSPGFFLSPSVIPFHSPGWIVNNPLSSSWYNREGCGVYSIESFWQSTKILMIRFDKYKLMSDKEINHIYKQLSISPIA